MAGTIYFLVDNLNHIMQTIKYLHTEFIFTQFTFTI